MASSRCRSSPIAIAGATGAMASDNAAAATPGSVRSPVSGSRSTWAVARRGRGRGAPRWRAGAGARAGACSVRDLLTGPVAAARCRSSGSRDASASSATRSSPIASAWLTLRPARPPGSRGTRTPAAPPGGPPAPRRRRRGRRRAGAAGRAVARGTRRARRYREREDGRGVLHAALQGPADRRGRPLVGLAHEVHLAEHDDERRGVRADLLDEREVFVAERVRPVHDEQRGAHVRQPGQVGRGVVLPGAAGAGGVDEHEPLQAREPRRFDLHPVAPRALPGLPVSVTQSASADGSMASVSPPVLWTVAFSAGPNRRA